MNDRDRLFIWMKANHLRAKDVAARMGVAPHLISMIKHGHRNISPLFKYRFREAFGEDARQAVFSSASIETTDVSSADIN